MNPIGKIIDMIEGNLSEWTAEFGVMNCPMVLSLDALCRLTHPGGITIERLEVGFDDGFYRQTDVWQIYFNGKPIAMSSDEESEIAGVMQTVDKTLRLRRDTQRNQRLNAARAELIDALNGPKVDTRPRPPKT